mmetsp:Transcript_22753/g.58573  ORF Transcript_22753/g.58573 Transcript_22753/m.58573 type:complete len:246 (+) Transcript_22753:97-834(+)
MRFGTVTAAEMAAAGGGVRRRRAECVCRGGAPCRGRAHELVELRLLRLDHLALLGQLHLGLAQQPLELGGRLAFALRLADEVGQVAVVLERVRAHLCAVVLALGGELQLRLRGCAALRLDLLAQGHRLLAQLELRVDRLVDAVRLGAASARVCAKLLAQGHLVPLLLQNDGALLVELRTRRLEQPAQLVHAPAELGCAARAVRRVGVRGVGVLGGCLRTGCASATAALAGQARARDAFGRASLWA